MPTHTTRAPRASRRPSPQRRGIAGGWLQRRQPEPSGINKALATARRALPRSKGALAAGGVAILGAAGVIARRRTRAS